MDYDEFDQFTKEIGKGTPLAKDKNRAVYAAAFVLNKNGKLTYYSKSPKANIDVNEIKKIVLQNL